MKRFLLFLLLAGFSFAQSLSVEKLLEKTDLSVGDNVQVLLKFSNPFGQQVPIKIVDKNILGGNGLDIQCLEYALPPDASTVVGYDPITAFQAGAYTLEKASITYTNPKTGKEETISSNPFDVTIKPSGAQGTQQGITTIYQCGGTSVRSTSFSSSSHPQQPQSQQQQQSQQTQDKLQGMQQQNMQDMNSVKQQMEQQQQQENALKNSIEQNPDFKKLQYELQKQGYSPQKSRITPEPQSSQQTQQNPSQQNKKSQSQNPSASFQYDYQKATGENATIQGRMDNGNMTEISKWSAEDAKALSDKITQNPKFQQLSQSLQKQGFNQTGQKISPPSANLSQFTYSFSNLNETRNITGTATPQGNITSIKIEQPPKKSDLYFWLFLLLLLLLAYFLYRKSRKPLPPMQPEAHMHVNPRKEALSMIARAELLFSEHKTKEAFSLLSGAVRFYFRHRFVSEKKELTTLDLLTYLQKHNRRKLKPAKDCIGLCDLVVFARFSPDGKAFSRAASLAKKLVSR